jgi:hypothetical protein
MGQLLTGFYEIIINIIPYEQEKMGTKQKGFGRFLKKMSFVNENPHPHNHMECFQAIW